MNFSERNRKVAISRWKRKHSEEIRKIKNDPKNLVLKASICGFLAGDGSVQIRKEKNFLHYQIDFFPDDTVMRNTYINQIREVYNKYPSIRKLKNHEAIRLTSKVIVQDLVNIASFGTFDWTMPNCLFSLKNAKEYWLKAFFSGEAYVNSKSIKVQTVNEKGMIEIKNLLSNLGISSKLYEYSPLKKTHSKVHILFINRKEDRLKYHNKIGFWHKKKTKILKLALDL